MDFPALPAMCSLHLQAALLDTSFPSRLLQHDVIEMTQYVHLWPFSPVSGLEPALIMEVPGPGLVLCLTFPPALNFHS